jgi:membrane fusion protein, copper/silver efflux system
MPPGPADNREKENKTMIKNIRLKKWTGAVSLVLVGLLAGYLLFSSVPHDHDYEPGHVHDESCAHETDGESRQAAGDADAQYWTCSMHPAVRSDEPGSCPICGMDLIPVREDRDLDVYTMEMSEAAVALARIRTTPVVRGTPEKRIRLPGRIQVDERRMTYITAHFPGRIRNLRVDFTGAPIRSGEPMATIYSPELVAAQRELLEALRRQDRLPAMVESAREKLRRWELSEEQIRAIEERGEVQTDLDIISPVDGFVLARNVTREQHVEEGSILFEVADLTHVWAVFEAYEEDVKWISPGDPISFQLRAHPGQVRNATVSYIDPTINPERRTVRVRADVENPEGHLKPDMLAHGEIAGELSEEGLMVPASAVLWTGPRSMLFVLDTEAERPRFEAREVLLGHRSGDFYVIEEGVEEGEHVVFHGAFRVDSEFQLADRFSMMNREPGRGAPVLHDHGPPDEHLQDEGIIGAPPEIFHDEVPADFREAFTRLLLEYVSLKEALVDSDLGNAIQTGEKFIQALETIGEHRMTGDAHVAWMVFYNNILSHAQSLTEANDLEAVRGEFRFLSNVLIEALISLGADDHFYVQFCPMAFDNQGGHWISDEDQIRNPYLPETMLRCGEVIEELGGGH